MPLFRTQSSPNIPRSSPTSAPPPLLSPRQRRSPFVQSPTGSYSSGRSTSGSGGGLRITMNGSTPRRSEPSTPVGMTALGSPGGGPVPPVVLTVRVGAFEFRTDAKLGQGSFGAVYAGQDSLSGRQVAIKLEPITGDLDCSLLVNEAHAIIKMGGGEGMPRYLGWSVVSLPIPSGRRARSMDDASFPWGVSPKLADYRVMIVERLGQNLETLLHATPGRRFPLDTVLVIAIQMLERLEWVHMKGYLHRDLKPDNIVVGLNTKDLGKVFLVDFGFATPFKSPTGVHVSPTSGGGKLIGTHLYMSRSASKGTQSSRRDDLESLGYVLLSLLVPQLPWAALARHMDVLFLHRGRTQQVAVEASVGLADMVRRVREAKEGVMRACQAGRPAVAVGGGGVEGRGVNEAFSVYFRNVDALRFEERPDYKALRAIFLHCAAKNGFSRSLRIRL